MNILTRRWRRTPPAGAVTRSVSRTHVGRVRSVNEDRVLDRPDRRLWAVADGMGGHSAGDVAAQAAIDSLAALADDPAALTTARIIEALAEVNRAILGQARSGGSGTTIVAAWVEDATVTLFWAGDSRAYLVRDHLATLLTHDHSLVQQLLDAGAVTQAQAACHPQGNVITRALGIDANLAIETATAALLPGDRLLLCSDGLHRSCDTADLGDASALDAWADLLLTNALRRDGGDNVSLVAVEPALRPA